MFQDQWSRKVGEDIASDVAALGSAPPACGGAMQLSQTPAYWRANGLVDRKWTASAKIVLLVDADKRLAGYGVVPRRASDLSPFGYNDGRQVDWQGHVLPNSRAPLSAWLASPKAIVCRIAVQG
jgi:hypothetical protein